MYLITEKIGEGQYIVYTSETFDIKKPISRWQLPGDLVSVAFEVLTQMNVIDSEGRTEAHTLVNNTILSILKELK